MQAIDILSDHGFEQAQSDHLEGGGYFCELFHGILIHRRIGCVSNGLKGLKDSRIYSGQRLKTGINSGLQNRFTQMKHTRFIFAISGKKFSSAIVLFG